MSEYRLVMKGVVKTFPGVKALDHAQLELRPGKVMALMGENGAGKSTLMKCMFGIYKMDTSSVYSEQSKYFSLFDLKIEASKNQFATITFL